MQEVAEKGLEKGRKMSKVRLKEREYEVLLELDKWGVLGIGQLEGMLFWKGSDTAERVRLLFNEYGRDAYDRYGYKRLVKLEGAGYVRIITERGQERIYTLSRQGKTALNEVRMSGKADMRRTWADGIVHAYVRWNGVGVTLARLLGAGVRSRHQLATAARAKGLHEAQIQSRIPDLMIDGPVPMAMLVRRYIDWEKESKRWLSGERCFWLYLASSELWRDAVVHHAKSEGADDVFAAEESEFRERLGDTVCVSPKGWMTLSKLIAQPAAASGAA